MVHLLALLLAIGLPDAPDPLSALAEIIIDVNADEQASREFLELTPILDGVPGACDKTVKFIQERRPQLDEIKSACAAPDRSDLVDVLAERPYVQMLQVVTTLLRQDAVLYASAGEVERSVQRIETIARLADAIDEPMLEGGLMIRGLVTSRVILVNRAVRHLCITASFTRTQADRIRSVLESMSPAYVLDLVVRSFARDADRQAERILRVAITHEQQTAGERFLVEFQGDLDRWRCPDVEAQIVPLDEDGVREQVELLVAQTHALIEAIRSPDPIVAVHRVETRMEAGEFGLLPKLGLHTALGPHFLDDLMALEMEHDLAIEALEGVVE